MKIFIIMIALILIAILLTIRIKHVLGRRRTEFEIIQSQQLINEAMNNLFTQTSIDHSLNLPEHLNSTLIANIWGHNVMAFEMQIEYKQRLDPKILQQSLNNELKKYCFQQQIPQIDQEIAPIVITDLWYDQIKPILHIDVANVNNQQTLAYLHDLKKLNQPFQT
ncbi:hypothetical protein G7084_04750 [Weissella coleopterorum]|uniref:Uncharacterized protein n=1 Tax=Weissella coleopterorum TaxID=2714949 RepID=A0A6G8B0D6_9LACO|nr:hypothetical protein [Weissella coleopterorum]QIL50682.1 hypothetical protein G7084_04750 [Weissella coleopterorum]